jgi:Rieske Fe-S protein
MQTSTQTSADAGKRDFLKYILGGSLIAWLAAVLYPLVEYLKPPIQPEVEVSTVKFGKVSDFEPGSGHITRFGNKPVIVIRTPSGEFKAFSATCTHLDCTVQYRNDLGIIWCACHNGKYDLTGRNIGGPPPRPLTAYKVTIQEDEVIISKNA